MAQFDVLRVRSSNELVIDCQSNLLRHLPTRFVIPLFPLDAGFTPAQHLNPILQAGSEKLMLGTQYALSIPLRELTETVWSLEAFRLDIIRALDVMLGGV